MFLKSLTLKGFKSFAEASTLELEPGVTVVVGPNGSGKSNVVDAIAWVLGAQAPSSVRSQKMDDVIFAGTTKRAALGRAEVSLTLDNESGILPIEFTEVTITRTLFRTGESEYAINGAPVRLLDVQDLLSDAGVGRQQHVIVSQGQIDAVLNARPEDRRAIIEEAAGVLKFRKRKEKAERRLEATEGNLLRVQDLMREVRRQLRPLERQAEAARRHGDLIAELSALRVFLAGREIAGLRARMTAVTAEHQSLSRSELDLRDALARLDTEVLATEAELSARSDTDVSDAMMRVEQLRERARGIANVIVERRRSLDRDRGQLMDAGVVANLESEAARIRDESAQIEAALATIEPEAEVLMVDEETFARERAETVAALDAAGSGPARATGAAGEVRGELRSTKASVERAESERQRLQRRRDELAGRAERSESEAQRLRAACEEAESVEEPLVGQLEAAEARRIAADAAVGVLQSAEQEARRQLSHWTARAEALGQALDSARSRAGAQRLVGLDGVLGSLLELIKRGEIHHDGDLPARSGLGSSSSFTVGLVHALAALKGSYISKDQLARDAIHIEQNVIGELVGSQDQIAATYGGLNIIHFNQDSSFRVEPVAVSRERVSELEKNLCMLYTGSSRLGGEVASKVIAAMRDRTAELRQMRKLVDDAHAFGEIHVFPVQCRELLELTIVERAARDGVGAQTARDLSGQCCIEPAPHVVARIEP